MEVLIKEATLGNTYKIVEEIDSEEGGIVYKA